MATLILPGDHIPVASSSAVKLGPGLAIQSAESQQELIATAVGMLGRLETSSKGKSKVEQTSIWIESDGKRYIPALHDRVICQITNRGAESYAVTLLNSFTPASLPALAFEGATKRNKPNLRVNTLLYAQVSNAQRHTEVELTCVDASTGKSNGFGELKVDKDNSTSNTDSKRKATTNDEATANIWPVSCGLARSLLVPGHSLLPRLASHFPFEVAIGVNGFVWVRAESAKYVIAVGKVLEQADLTINKATAKGADAVQAAKSRGTLSPQTIARIVTPFK